MVRLCVSVTCGNTVGLMGLDDYILKTATLTSVRDASPIKVGVVLKRALATALLI